MYRIILAALAMLLPASMASAATVTYTASGILTDKLVSGPSGAQLDADFPYEPISTFDLSMTFDPLTPNIAPLGGFGQVGEYAATSFALSINGSPLITFGTGLSWGRATFLMSGFDGGQGFALVVKEAREVSPLVSGLETLSFALSFHLPNGTLTDTAFRTDYWPDFSDYSFASLALYRVPGDGVAVYSRNPFPDSPYMTSFTVAMSGAPEPATWMSLIAGFGLVGAAMRRKRRTVAA